MKKVGVPTANGLLSPHFGGSEYFSVFNIENNKIISEEILPTPEHTTGSFPNFLAQQNITDIVVGGIGGKAIEIFNSFNINVYVGADVKLPKIIAEEFISGSLVLTGNSCNHEGDGPESHGGEHHHHH
jgi:predicted Fe-Mo cluster-binding NifX family protein